MKKVFKKISSILIVTLLLVTFVACGSVTPTSYVSEFLDETKSLTLDDIGGEDAIFASLGDVPEGLGDTLLGLMTGFEYTIISEEIGATSATVVVEIKAWDTSDVPQSTFSDLVASMLAGELDSSDTAAIEAETFELLNDKLVAAMSGEKTYVTEVTLTLNGADGDYTLTDTDELMDAITGGLLSGFATVSQ